MHRTSRAKNYTCECSVCERCVRCVFRLISVVDRLFLFLFVSVVRFYDSWCLNRTESSGRYAQQINQKQKQQKQTKTLAVIVVPFVFVSLLRRGVESSRANE